MKILEPSEIEKAKSIIVSEIIDYVPNTIIIKTIVRKRTGNISLMSFDKGKELPEKTTPFDTFVQIVDGSAEIVIDKEIHSLKSGDSIIIPAHKLASIKAKVRFKILSTVIKSGYDDLD